MKNRLPVVVSSVVAVLIVAGGLFYLSRPDPVDYATPADAAPVVALTTGSATPPPSASSPAPTSAKPSSARPSSAKPTTVKPKPKPSLSPKPVTGPTPPAQPPASPPGSPQPGASCPKLTGTPAPLADVQAALNASAATAYWGNGITLRPELIAAVAWEESGWQSTILACDGDTGTMQVMPATGAWMNGQCGTNYSLTSLTGNVAIGAEYLEWLVRYFGHRYFNDDYSLKGDPDKLVLLDVVIAAYQQGFGVIDNALTNHTDLPNWWYIGAVETFMTSKPWVAALAGTG